MHHVRPLAAYRYHHDVGVCRPLLCQRRQPLLRWMVTWQALPPPF